MKLFQSLDPFKAIYDICKLRRHSTGASLTPVVSYDAFLLSQALAEPIGHSPITHFLIIRTVLESDELCIERRN